MCVFGVCVWCVCVWCMCVCVWCVCVWWVCVWCVCVFNTLLPRSNTFDIDYIFSLWLLLVLVCYLCISIEWLYTNQMCCSVYLPCIIIIPSCHNVCMVWCKGWRMVYGHCVWAWCTGIVYGFGVRASCMHGLGVRASCMGIVYVHHVCAGVRAKCKGLVYPCELMGFRSSPLLS